MKVMLFSCGPAANESELRAFEYLKGRLLSESGNEEWILLANLAFSVTNQLQSDEIDLIVIGPIGVRVIEIKHWTAQWVDTHPNEVEDHAERVTNKARKIGTTLRRTHPDLPRVDGVILLTQEPSKVKRIAGQAVRGVGFYTLNDWKSAIGFDDPRMLTQQQVKLLATVLQPRSVVASDGALRRLAGYVNLELQTPKDQRFPRVYKGSHPAHRDKVILYLYDLSASDDKNAEAKARREFEALHHLQLYSWAPRILDSFQDAPGYSGEMYFFTVVDPAAPCIEDRIADATWSVPSRIAFARDALRALKELHQAGADDEPLIHRNLTPRTVLVKHDNTPILTGFERTRIPSEVSVTSSSLPTGTYLDMVAPEVQLLGFAAADRRSDLFSLCACLSHLFQDRSEVLSQRAMDILARGLSKEPGHRSELKDIDAALSELLGESVPPPPPPARFWTEDQVIPFHGSKYRIISSLGSGGVGTAYKVVEIDRVTKEELGTFVAKVAHSSETGQSVLKAYRLARSHLHHTALSGILEVAQEWQENEFIALMSWISGTPLAEFTGIFSLLAEEQQEASSEALALRWIRTICEALDVLHRNGLIHGDVSPRNLIVSGSDLVLTDYDFVCKVGEPLTAPGTVLYCSPSYQEKQIASPADDIYALAASFFHVVFEKEPFLHQGERDKKRGINWTGVNRTDYQTLASFLDQATHPNSELRFANATAALTALKQVPTAQTEISHSERPPTDTVVIPTGITPRQELHEQQIEWLLSLLQSYPGSQWGNQETRGLDTEFAALTYVPTALEDILVKDVSERRVRLVILCGNAGDGKTALLQHLAGRLGLGKYQSSDRILVGNVPNGPLVRINLDGSASWQGQSADEILDEFLAEFQQGAPSQDIVHLLAINDGRLLEWIEGYKVRYGEDETPLTSALSDLLQQDFVTKASHIRFFSLNQRSLVGGITADAQQIETDFLRRLLDHLYGDKDVAKIWSPCLICSAQDRCEVFQAARVFGPDTFPTAKDSLVRSHARARLFEALQAVHMRGETHITIRELRSALVYILFGTHFCTDYHAESELHELPFWDRAFAANSPARQGEVLRELERFDPALEAHPQIDRYLRSMHIADSVKTAPHYPHLALESARRRAFFEWTPNDIQEVAGDVDALDLARGRHLRKFKELPIDKYKLAEVCKRVCEGISRLEDLPPQALGRPDVVPLRITPRTPTETAFWVEKPLSSFRLEADLPPEIAGIERLHRQAYLVYRYRNGQEEPLRMGAELFHLLLELADGYQLGDVSTDDTFAQLSIFVQRLVREDEHELLAWNPIQDEVIYQVHAGIRDLENYTQQQMIITPLVSGAQL